MNYSKISDETFSEGWGSIFQGEIIDEDIDDIPGPLVVVNMRKDQSDEEWIHRSRKITGLESNGHIQGILSICIEDHRLSVLSDNIFLSMVDSVITFLKRGINVYVHCRYGLSRSTYLTAGVFMKLKGWGLKETLQYIESRRKNAFPNWGFYDHLEDLHNRDLLK